MLSTECALIIVVLVVGIVLVIIFIYFIQREGGRKQAFPSLRCEVGRGGGDKNRYVLFCSFIN